jgi:cytochrome b subunit of formate dehydrogenase
MASDSELARFDLVERLVHWSTAIMMLTLIVTGAILYLPALALRAGIAASSRTFTSSPVSACSGLSCSGSPGRGASDC